MRYNMSNITVESMSAELVRDAASIRIMRVVSRLQVPADPVYLDWLGPLYEYRLETVETLSGRVSGVLSFTAPDDDWIVARIPGFRRLNHEPLHWLTPQGYEALQDTSIYLANDFHSTTCAGAVTFEIGAEYLVFTGVDGHLLQPGLRGRAGWQTRPVRRQRPVLEQVHGAGDPWLAAVRTAVQRRAGARRH